MVRVIPFFVLSEHRIQDSQQFSHTGNQRKYLLFFCTLSLCQFLTVVI